MSAHLFRVPISGSPHNAAYFVAAESPLEAYNKVGELYPSPLISHAPLYFNGVAEVRGLFVADEGLGGKVLDFLVMDGRNPVTSHAELDDIEVLD